MSKFSHLALVMAMLSTTVSASAQQTAYGYTMLPSSSPAMISFNTDDLSTTTRLGTYSKAEPRSGAAAKDVLYVMGVDDDFNTMFYSMDMTTGESTTIKKLGDASVPADMSYDYSTKTMYSVANSDVVDGVSALSTVNLETGKITTVNNDLGYYCKAIAVDARGQMYLMTNSGLLLKTNKSTGASEVIGNTGITFAGWWNFQSMEFDRKTGTLYLAAWTSDEKTLLYTIDTATAEATLVGQIGDGTHTIALSIPYDAVNGNAPDMVSDLVVTADAAGGLQATISWTNPAVDFDGNPLEGNINIEYTSSVTGTKQVIENCVPGQTMQITEAVPQNGMYTITVVAANAAGASLEQTAQAWIGRDVPGAPLNAHAGLNLYSLMVNDLTWDMPTVGAHGGYIDQSSLKYDIVRVNDGEQIATDLTETSFSDERLIEALTRYSYQIIAKNADGMGEAATTNDLVNGPAAECPYVAPFNSWEESGQYWTVIDGNGDGYPFTWYNDYMNMFGQGENKGYYIYQKSETFYGFDFIVSPPIQFQEGHEYKITANVSNDDIAGYREESFRFYTMAGYSLNGATPLGDESFTVKHPGEFRDYSFTFKVEDDGQGSDDETFPSFIALCCTSHYDMGMLLVSSIQVEDLTASTVLRGDVDNDGNVNISDVTTLINHLLKGTTPVVPQAADCDGDGKMNISDVTTLINYLLKGAWNN